MAKFTLICEHDSIDDDVKFTTEFESNYLPIIVSNMEKFLRGSGYHFDGLEIKYDLLEDSNSSEIFSKIVQDLSDSLERERNS
jgi:formylmethanofuran dehydrogenase subunit B